MQIGARWRVGAAPHSGVPTHLHELIRSTEAKYPASSSWTLTWLENSPVCSLDDVAVIAVANDGQPYVARDINLEVRDDDDDEDWL